MFQLGLGQSEAVSGVNIQTALAASPSRLPSLHSEQGVKPLLRNSL